MLFMADVAGARHGLPGRAADRRGAGAGVARCSRAEDSPSCCATPGPGCSRSAAEFADRGAGRRARRPTWPAVILDRRDPVPDAPAAACTELADLAGAGRLDGRLRHRRATPPRSGSTPPAPPARRRRAMHRHGAHRASSARPTAAQVLGDPPGRPLPVSAAKLFFAYGLGNTRALPALGRARRRPRPAPPEPGRARRAAAQTYGADAVLRRADVLRRMLRARAARRRARRRARLRLGRRGAAGGAVPSGSPATSASTSSTASARPRRCTSSCPTGRARSGPARPATPVPGYDAADRRRRRAPRSRRARPAPATSAASSAATGYWCRIRDHPPGVPGRLAAHRRHLRPQRRDGYYTCLGRTDDMIKAGGIWVSPAEVEERLLRTTRRSRRPSSWSRARHRRAGQAGRLRRPRPRRRRSTADELVAVLPGRAWPRSSGPARPGVRSSAHDRHRQAPALPHPRAGARAPRRADPT